MNAQLVLQLAALSNCVFVCIFAGVMKENRFGTNRGDATRLQPLGTRFQCVQFLTDNLCDKVQFYPSKFVDMALSNAGFVNSPSNAMCPIDVAFESSCPYEEKIIYPQGLRNSRGQLLYIANTPSFQQSILVRICKITGSFQCQEAPTGYYSVCEQQYATTTVIVVDPQTGQSYPQRVQYPSDCTCQLQGDGTWVFKKSNTSWPQTTSA